MWRQDPPMPSRLMKGCRLMLGRTRADPAHGHRRVRRLSQTRFRRICPPTLNDPRLCRIEGMTSGPRTLLVCGLLFAGANACSDSEQEPSPSTDGSAQGPDAPLPAVAVGAGRQLNVSFEADPLAKLDLLFVIDNSASMAEEQANLARNIPELLRQLERTPGGLPDMHIGFVSSSFGAGPTQPTPTCPPLGDTGRLQVKSGCGFESGGRSVPQHRRYRESELHGRPGHGDGLFGEPRHGRLRVSAPVAGGARGACPDPASREPRVRQGRRPPGNRRSQQCRRLLGRSGKHVVRGHHTRSGARLALRTCGSPVRGHGRAGRGRVFGAAVVLLCSALAREPGRAPKRPHRCEGLHRLREGLERRSGGSHHRGGNRGMEFQFQRRLSH